MDAVGEDMELHGELSAFPGWLCKVRVELVIDKPTSVKSILTTL